MRRDAVNVYIGKDKVSEVGHGEYKGGRNLHRAVYLYSPISNAAAG